MIYNRNIEAVGKPAKLKAAKRIPATPEIRFERVEKCLPCPRNTLAPSVLGRCKSCVSCGAAANLEVKIAALLETCPLKKWSH